MVGAGVRAHSPTANLFFLDFAELGPILLPGECWKFDNGTFNELQQTLWSEDRETLQTSVHRRKLASATLYKGGFAGTLSAASGLDYSRDAASDATTLESLLLMTRGKLSFGSCAQNRSSYAPDFLEAVAKVQDALLPGNSSDVYNWNILVTLLFSNFGTHVVTAAQFGAQLHISASSRSNCFADASCSQSTACASFGFLDASLCGGTEKCSAAAGCVSAQVTTCQLTEGFASISEDGCSRNATLAQAAVAELRMAVQNDATELLSRAPVTLDLRDLDWLLFELTGNETLRQIVQRSIEIDACVQTNPLLSPFAWDYQTASCVCAAVCGPNTKLDESSCTCKCNGDLQHGFQGNKCENSYGSCQAGAGTLDVKVSCAGDNMCNASTFGGAIRCQATEVCCQSFSTTVCGPYGAVCVDCNNYYPWYPCHVRGGGSSLLALSLLALVPLLWLM
jgi:hypothetical protein